MPAEKAGLNRGRAKAVMIEFQKNRAAEALQGSAASVPAMAVN
jgi:hypothetical protein